MSAGATPDGPGDTERPSVPGAGSVPAAGAPTVRPATGPDSPMRVERRRRMLALAGATVRGSDGKSVGRVRDIYLQDASGELAAITVMPRQLSARSVLIPAAAIAALPQEPQDTADPSVAVPGASAPDAPAPDAPERGEDHVLHLLVDARTAKAGARPPQTLHASPAALQAAMAALHLEEGSARA